MIDHELTDPTGTALTITHNIDGVWVTATDALDEVTVGPFPVTSLTEAVTVESDAEVSGDLMDGGVTSAAIESEAACGFCHGIAVACGQLAPDGTYACTRREGHDLPHVACCPEEHMLSTWPEKCGLDPAHREAEVVSPERARSLVQERDEAKAWATRWQEAAEENEAEIDRLRAALAGALATVQTARSDLTTALAGYARPLTADDITDEMVERGARQYIEEDYTSWERSPALAKNNAHESVRGILEAALTPLSPRPEGAEKIEALVDAWKLVPFSPDCPRPTLPDFLAVRGVRVTGGEL